ncbi:hypothetical protein E3N88_24149 [Mikania micrantha]|uniref:Pentacotripeptide-repeat region of PRORP domain-containing protein n=1 Tax=Mikania micrantha TaxID=192012 RepID=A0A5N6NHZ7_9ASTR|nr:hypothetical protein E3N88_24149 [Mikania micrantha]
MAFQLQCSVPPFPFDQIDLKTWNKIIKRQAIEGNTKGAFQSYQQMQESFTPDNFTYPVLLKAVSNLSDRRLGLALHAQIAKTPFRNHMLVQTSLLNMYSFAKEIVDARKVFDEMQVKDIVALNSMLDAYVSSGNMDTAIQFFQSMPERDLFSFNIMLSGYAEMGDLDSASKLFNEMPQRNIISWNSMILACGKHGDMEEAHKVFDEMPERDVISWNTLIGAYLNNGLFDQVIMLFETMKADKMYVQIILRLPQPYLLSKSQDVFCWNALISGLALHGYGVAAFKMFDEMMQRTKPDDITFIAMLSACSHSGLIKEGQALFESMDINYGVTPRMEHYGCIVDLLGRAGFLENAYMIIETMPFRPGRSVLGALLSACVNYKDLEIGEKIVKMLLSVEGEDGLNDGDYMMVSNLYASCDQWDEADRWRAMMNDSGIVKTAGLSSIEVGNRVHKFLAGDMQ